MRTLEATDRVTLKPETYREFLLGEVEIRAPAIRVLDMVEIPTGVRTLPELPTVFNKLFSGGPGSAAAISELEEFNHTANEVYLSRAKLKQIGPRAIIQYAKLERSTVQRIAGKIDFLDVTSCNQLESFDPDTAIGIVEMDFDKVPLLFALKRPPNAITIHWFDNHYDNFCAVKEHTREAIVFLTFLAAPLVEMLPYYSEVLASVTAIENIHGPLRELAPSNSKEAQEKLRDFAVLQIEQVRAAKQTKIPDKPKR